MSPISSTTSAVTTSSLATTMAGGATPSTVWTDPMPMMRRRVGHREDLAAHVHDAEDEVRHARNRRDLVLLEDLAHVAHADRVPLLADAEEQERQLVGDLFVERLERERLGALAQDLLGGLGECVRRRLGGRHALSPSLEPVDGRAAGRCRAGTPARRASGTRRSSSTTARAAAARPAGSPRAARARLRPRRRRARRSGRASR